MQHPIHDPAKGPRAGTAGIHFADPVATADEIEHHIAEGKRLQAEAIAAMLRAAFRRLAAPFRRRPARHGGDLPAGARPAA
ncbi:MAG: RSP_7527 family protein [Kiloniellaceae bacterium]